MSAVVVKTKYEPVPANIYNLQILSYDEEESSKNKGQTYYKWKIRVLDTLPDTYNGKGEFTVLTATVLTDKNNLNKLLVRVNAPQVELGEGFDLDSLVGHKFVGKVIVKKNGDNENNDLGDMAIAEYEAFKSKHTHSGVVKGVAKSGVVSKPAGATSATLSKPGVVKTSPPATKPVEEVAVVEEGEGDGAVGEDEFPE